MLLRGSWIPELLITTFTSPVISAAVDGGGGEKRVSLSHRYTETALAKVTDDSQTA